MGRADCSRSDQEMDGSRWFEGRLSEGNEEDLLGVAVPRAGSWYTEFGRVFNT